MATLAGAVLVTTAAVPGATAGPAADRAAAKPTPTDIGLIATAYGTRLTGGQLPAGSGRTAHTVMGCSAPLGSSHHNHLAALAVPGLGTISGATTKVWSRRDGREYHSYARSTTADVVIAQSGLGRLSLKGVTSLAHAWYDGSRFHSETTAGIAKLVFTPPAGGPQTLPLPDPGQPITVPGLATIRVGGSRKVVTRDHSQAFAVGLRINIIPTESTLWVSRSGAHAVSGLVNGRFSGFSAGTDTEVAGGVLTSGRNAISYMPCQGTGGQVLRNDLADVDAGGGLHIDAIGSQQWGERGAHASRAWEQGSATGIDLGDGALVIDAVVGRASVVRKKHGPPHTSTAGTRIGSITANGEPQELPFDQVLEIPGVAKLEPRVVTKAPGGIKVIALRLTLLDGSGAIINLGVARVGLRK